MLIKLQSSPNLKIPQCPRLDYGWWVLGSEKCEVSFVEDPNSRTESVALRCKSTYEILRTSIYLERKRKLTAGGLWGSGNVSLVSMQRQIPRTGSIKILCKSTCKILRSSKFPQTPTQPSSSSVLGARHVTSSVSTQTQIPRTQNGS